MKLRRCPTCRSQSVAGWSIALLAIGWPSRCRSCGQALSISAFWQTPLTVIFGVSLVLGAAFSTQLRSLWPYALATVPAQVYLALVAFTASPLAKPSHTFAQSAFPWIVLIAFAAVALFGGYGA